MLDILIIAHFTQVPGEAGNGRFHYIAEKINKTKATVEVVTTSFSHKNKYQRQVTDEQLDSLSYRLTMLYEPGYRKNVSLKRIISHSTVGRNLNSYLLKRKKPDVIYCAVPSLDVAGVAARYAENNNIRFIIDIQDLWPEAFEMVFRVPYISNLLFYSIRQKANYIYASADEIVAVSQTYVNRALEVNSKCKVGYSVYLGTELESFDKFADNNRCAGKPMDEIWLAYIGTLGHSYDLICVIDALKKIKGKCNIKFIVMGDGPLKSQFERYAKEQGVYAEFTGRLHYGKMVGILKACDIAVNPISPGAAQSIINKHGDYASAGLPVINSQECIEYRNLVEEYQMGLNCENKNAEDMAEKLLKLCNDEALRKVMGENSRRLAEDKFDRKKTYKKIISLLEGTM